MGTHNQLFLIIDTIMSKDNGQTIEQKANELMQNEESMPLNETYDDYVWRKNDCLYILVTAEPRTVNSVALSTISPEMFHIPDNDEMSEEIINDDITNTNTNNQKKKKKKHKKKKKKRVRSNDSNHNKKRYEFSSDDEYDDSDYKEEINMDFQSDSDDDFIPPLKRRKINALQSQMSLKMRSRNPSRSRLSNRNESVSRHRHIRIFDHRNARRSKSQKKRQSNEKPNHCVILLDTSHSMQSAMNYQNVYNEEEDTQVSRLTIAWNHIRRFVQRKWKETALKGTCLSLATFGKCLDIKVNALKGYSAENVKKIMKSMQRIERDQKNNKLSKQTALFDALYELIGRLGRRMRSYQNVRIVMFTDGENWSMAPQYQEIKDLLKQTKITIDCIQCTRSERDKEGLKKLCCQHSKDGRFWNPLTLGDWNGIFESVDFLWPHKRAFVYDLTLDDDDSDSDDAD